MLKRGYNSNATRNPLERHACQSILHLNDGNWDKINIIYVIYNLTIENILPAAGDSILLLFITVN